MSGGKLNLHSSMDRLETEFDHALVLSAEDLYSSMDRLETKDWQGRLF